MSEIIKSQIAIAKKEIKAITGKDLSDDKAFSHLLLKHFYDVNYLDQIDLVTDGTNDGGVDFLYYDEEENKVIICQSKYTGTLSIDDVIIEFDKMYSTVQNFKKAHTGSYNEKVKRALQNALDRLPEGNENCIEYNLFTTSSVSVNGVKNKIENTEHSFSIDTVSIYSGDEIEKTIQRNQETLSTVSYEKIKLDKAKNYLKYDSDDFKGIFCSILSSSLIQLYNKYSGAGLFDLNIRRYIKNKLVDDGITKTLDSDRENFWFLNNGIIIACTDFYIDGDTVKLENFSIVNGGQTTQIIGTYKGKNKKEFYIPCKIVAPITDSKENSKAHSFYTKIAEATNSQKPIYPKDLKSNTPEMRRLHEWLKQENIYMEIKRGYKPTKKYLYSIKNDSLGQLILSFALQQPGTSRNGKVKVFEAGNYDRIFKVDYEKDSAKKGFLIDLIDLAARYDDVEKRYKTTGLEPVETEILKNGKQMIFALLGVCYRLVNNDLTEDDLINSPRSVGTVPFVYGSFISNYHDDDLDNKLNSAIIDIVQILGDIYNRAYDNGKTTSVSNFFKSDARYYNEILPSFSKLLRYMSGQDLKQCICILKR